jgi:hypothetical protein
MKKSGSNQRTSAVTGFALLLFMSVASHAAEQPAGKPAERYQCTSEAGTGFSFDPSSRKWLQKNFHTRSKWVIQFDKVWNKLAVFEAGRSDSYFRCEERSPTSTLFNCTGLGEFSFNFANGRFIVRGFHSYLFPEFKGEKEGDSDEWIEIGHCRPL